MFSSDTIMTMQQEAAEQAARERRIPFVYWPGDNLGPPFPFPNLGSYVPDGWVRVREFMADSSGLGSPSEPADTPEQLRARIEREVSSNPGKTFGWAICEVGQFQVVIGQYLKVSANDPKGSTSVCPECNRVFDLTDENDAEEWFYGHDCEAD